MPAGIVEQEIEMVDEPGGAGAADTGGATGGADVTPGGGSGDSGSTPNAITSMDQVPMEIRNQIFDTGYGKGRQKEETRFMEQYGDHIELARMMSGQTELTDEVLDAMMDMPGFSGRVNRAVQKIQEGATDPATEALKREMGQLKQQMTQQGQQTWLQQVQTAISKEAGDDPIKRNLLMGRIQTMFKDVNTPTFSVEDIAKIGKEIDGELLEYKSGVKGDYIKRKESGKTKGAEGSAGSPPSPGKEEPAGEFGVMDEAFSASVRKQLEAAGDV